MKISPDIGTTIFDIACLLIGLRMLQLHGAAFNDVIGQ